MCMWTMEEGSSGQGQWGYVSFWDFSLRHLNHRDTRAYRLAGAVAGESTGDLRAGAFCTRTLLEADDDGMQDSAGKFAEDAEEGSCLHATAKNPTGSGAPVGHTGRIEEGTRRRAKEPGGLWGRGPKDPAERKATGQRGTRRDEVPGGGNPSTRGTRLLPGHPAPPECLASTSGDNAEMDWGRTAEKSSVQRPGGPGALFVSRQKTLSIFCALKLCPTDMGPRSSLGSPPSR